MVFSRPTCRASYQVHFHTVLFLILTAQNWADTLPTIARIVIAQSTKHIHTHGEAYLWKQDHGQLTLAKRVRCLGWILLPRFRFPAHFPILPSFLWDFFFLSHLPNHYYYFRQVLKNKFLGHYSKNNPADLYRLYLNDWIQDFWY